MNAKAKIVFISGEARRIVSRESSVAQVKNSIRYGRNGTAIRKNDVIRKGIFLNFCVTAIIKYSAAKR